MSDEIYRRVMMLPNKKIDPADNHPHEAIVQSSEPHMVVPCPSCKTKFAVESSLIAAFETPRFHCSRCDSVFDLRASSLVTSSPSGKSEWILADDAAPQHGAPTNARKSEESLLKPTDFSLGSPKPGYPVSPREPFAPLVERSGLSLLGLNVSATWLSPASLTREATQAHGNPEPTSTSINAESFQLFDPPNEPIAPAKEVSQPPQAPLPQASPATAPITGPSQPATRRAAAPPHAPHPSQSDPLQPTPARQLLISRALRRLSHRNYSLAALSAPVVCIMILLTTIGYSARLMPRTIDTTLEATVPALLSGRVSDVPPSELSVRDLSLEFVKTQSRELLAVVRGVVHNGTSNTLDDVQLEALGFNERGEIVARSQAPLRSALAREKVSELPLATVKKFQESLSARTAHIGAGEKIAFTIALLQPEDHSGEESFDLSQIKFFSARVFSVKKG